MRDIDMSQYISSWKVDGYDYVTFVSNGLQDVLNHLKERHNLVDMLKVVKLSDDDSYKVKRYEVEDNHVLKEIFSKYSEELSKQYFRNCYTDILESVLVYDMDNNSYEISPARLEKFVWECVLDDFGMDY